MGACWWHLVYVTCSSSTISLYLIDMALGFLRLFAPRSESAGSAPGCAGTSCGRPDTPQRSCAGSRPPEKKSPERVPAKKIEISRGCVSRVVSLARCGEDAREREHHPFLAGTPPVLAALLLGARMRSNVNGSPVGADDGLSHCLALDFVIRVLVHRQQLCLPLAPPPLLLVHSHDRFHP